MAEYHVLSNINQNYLFYFFVTYQSLVDSLEDRPDNAQDHFNFHVLVDEAVDLKQACYYVEAFKKFNAEAKVSFDFFFHRIDSSIFSSFKHMERDDMVSFTTYYRILMAHVIPPEVERLLYLDVDILVRADVRQIFQQYPLDNNEILVAASEFGYITHAENPLIPDPVVLFPAKQPDQMPLALPSRYGIQAGVLLISMPQWREQAIEQKCLQIEAQWQVNFWDQDLISIACQGNVKRLSWEWNLSFFPLLLNRDDSDGNKKYLTIDNLALDGVPTKEQLMAMCANPKIVHFADIFKPWSLLGIVAPHVLKEKEEFLPFMYDWLKIHTRFANFLKGFKS